MDKPQRGARVIIPVAQIEYVEGGDTIWIQSPLGATVLRIKTVNNNNVESEVCKNSPVSHADLRLNDSVGMCLGPDAEF